jgi:hypothetical protein
MLCGAHGVAKQISMDPFTFLVNLFGSCPEVTQNGLGYGQGHFSLAREYLFRSGLVQGGKFTHIGGTGEDPDRRVQLPRQPDNLWAGLYASGAENEAAGTGNPGTLQRLAVAGITVYR